MNLFPSFSATGLPALGRSGRAARVLAAALLAGSMVLPAAAEPARYEIDTEHMSLGFLVSHIGYHKVLGMFRAGKGSYSYDEKSGALTDIRIEVETASVYTNHRKRDEHIKGPDFLNSGEFPRMVFTATRGTRTGEKTFAVDGQLELLGRALPLRLQATMNKLADYELGGFFSKPYVMGVSARASFKRSAYGMSYGLDNNWVGDEIELLIEFEARRR